MKNQCKEVLNNKRGISLIVLIITIVVIIVLSVAIIINMSNTNMIGHANEAVFKSDIRGFSDQLYMYIANKYSENKAKYDAKKLNSEEGEIWYDNEKQDEMIEDVITSAKGTEYIEKIFIEEGELVLDGFEITEQEVKWAEEIGIKVSFEKGIKNLILKSTQTEVTAKVPVRYEELVKEYEYTIYKVTGEGTKEEKKEEVENKVIKENETTFTGLAQDKLYEVEVRIRFKYSNKAVERKERIRTKIVEELVEIIQEPEAKTETGETNWTSENVIVTLSHPNIPENYKIQYRIGESKDWITGNIVELNTNNTVVRGRLYNEKQDDEVAVKTREISNIDKESPTKPVVEITQSIENSITVKASGSKDSLSGLKGYTFSIDKNKWEDVEAVNGEASYTFNGIKSGTEVVVYVKAYDDIKVGKRNESEEASSSGTTIFPTISGLTLELTGTYTNSYFKDSVTPKVTYTSISTSAYVLQYKVGSGSWEAVASGTTLSAITANNTNIVFRLYNTSLQDEVISGVTLTRTINGGSSSVINTYQYNISNIDTDTPTAPTSVTVTAGVNSVTATASGSTDGTSGVLKYEYKTDNSEWQDSGTFSGIKAGVETTIYARAVDKVGHVSGTKSNSNSPTVPTISGLTLDLAGTYTNSYFKDKVTPKVTYTSISTSAYVLQYKVGSGSWTTVASGTTLSAITENNTNIVFRLYNSSLSDEVTSGVTLTRTINGVSSSAINTYQYNISNLDTDTPTAPTSVTVTAGVNSVTATASGSTDGTSGVLKYEYKTDNSEWQDSGTFSGIKAGVETTIYARAVDKVGHKSESKSNSSAPTVPTISGLTLDLAGTYKNSYFKDSVTPKVTYTSISTSAYVLQYKVGSGSWTTVASGTTLSAITANNTNIVFRLYNTSLKDEVVSGVTLTRTINGGSSSAINTYQYNISNLDTDTPTAPTTLNLSKSGNTITATASGSTDGTSGVLKYQYSKDNINWQDSGSFTGLTYGSTYTIYARAVDKVEHTSSNKSNSITIDKLNGGVTLSATSGTICVSKSTKFTVSKNTSGGSLSVKSSNTSVATVSLSGTTITVTGTSTAGTAKITVTSASTSSYNAASATYTVTVAAHSATTGGSLKSSATCTAAAVYYHKCSRCGINLSSTYTSGNALRHSYGSWVTTKAATCTVAGSKKRTCSRCSNVETATISATGHSDSCYSTACKGSFTLSSTTSQEYKVCSHTHSKPSSYGNSLVSGTAGSSDALYTTSGGCYTKSTTTSCTGTMKLIGYISSIYPHGESTSTCCNARIRRATNFNVKCNSCGITSTYSNSYGLDWCNSCGNWIRNYDGGRANASSTYYLNLIDAGKCKATRNVYALNCGKTAGTKRFNRTVETYKCNTCGKTTTYYKAASNSCSICGGTHSVSASGSTTATHNAVAKYLICDK